MKDTSELVEIDKTAEIRWLTITVIGNIHYSKPTVVSQFQYGALNYTLY
jgi:hypothetical protein